jgi:hypothetical protein
MIGKRTLIERDSPMTVTQPVAHSHKRAAPAPGKDSLLTVRAPLEIIDAVDTWAAKNGVTRSSAVRQLLEIGLKAKK